MTLSELCDVTLKVLGSADQALVRGINIMVGQQDDQSGHDVLVKINKGSATITLYPGILRLTDLEAVKAVITEYGRQLLNSADQKVKGAWERKLISPTADQVASYQSRLATAQFKNWNDLVMSIESASDRLVAIHLSNGLMVNGRKVGEARTIDVTTCATTAEYATGTRPHSLIPLLSAYAPANLNDFGDALAELAINNLQSIGESSVAKDLRRLVLWVVEQVKGPPPSQATLQQNYNFGISA